MTLANKITVVEGQGTSQPYVFYMAAQPALCIPALGLEDGPNGVGDGLTGVTQLHADIGWLLAGLVMPWCSACGSARRRRVLPG